MYRRAIELGRINPLVVTSVRALPLLVGCSNSMIADTVNLCMVLVFCYATMAINCCKTVYSCIRNVLYVQ